MPEYTGTHMSPEISNNGRSDHAGRSLNVIRSVVRALNLNTRAIEQRSGISLAQLFVLEKLHQQSSSSLTDLAERTATHQSSVSVVVQRLVDRGFVSRTRSASDRRFVEIAITDAGRQVLSNAPETVQAKLLNGLGQFRDGERERLAALLERWANSAGIEVPVETPMFLEDG